MLFRAPAPTSTPVLAPVHAPAPSFISAPAHASTPALSNVYTSFPSPALVFAFALDTTPASMLQIPDLGFLYPAHAPALAKCFSS